MTDLITRLRAHAKWRMDGAGQPAGKHICDEAADEIKRLKAEIARIRVVNAVSTKLLEEAYPSLKDHTP